MIEGKTKLKTIKDNKLSITRIQKRNEEISYSTLYYFQSSWKIEKFEIVGKANSDHLPMTVSINIKWMWIKNKNILITRNVIPSTEEIKDLLKSKDWPSKIDIEATKKICQKKLNIRPTINIQECANQILEIKSRKDAAIDIKTAMSKNFQDYVKDLDLLKTKDTAKFCRKVNNFLKYKVRGKIVKGILEGDVILSGKEKRNKVKQYFSDIYKSEAWAKSIWGNNIFNFNIDIDRAINSIAKNKAVGYDFIPGELYKNRKIETEFKKTDSRDTSENMYQ